jgi:hypothetical protein
MATSVSIAVSFPGSFTVTQKCDGKFPFSLFFTAVYGFTFTVSPHFGMKVNAYFEGTAVNAYRQPYRGRDSFDGKNGR